MKFRLMIYTPDGRVHTDSEIVARSKITRRLHQWREQTQREVAFALVCVSGQKPGFNTIYGIASPANGGRMFAVRTVSTIQLALSPS